MTEDENITVMGINRNDTRSRKTIDKIQIPVKFLKKPPINFAKPQKEEKIIQFFPNKNTSERIPFFKKKKIKN